MPTIMTSVGAVSYTDLGDGPPVLLLHAALHDASDYAPVHGVLAGGRRVIALDWPGHGASPTPDEPLGAPQLGDLAIEFVDTLDLSNLVVIGNSVGGYAACRIALERPERVAGVVLVNTGGFTPLSPFSRSFCALMGRPGVVRLVFPSFVRAYMRPATDADRSIVARVVARGRTTAGARTAAALWRSFTQPAHDLRQSGSSIAAPVLITWGTKDPTAPVRWGRLVAASIPGSEFVTQPTGHVVFSSEPEPWLGHVLPFVEAAQRAGRTAPRE